MAPQQLQPPQQQLAAAAAERSVSQMQISMLQTALAEAQRKIVELASRQVAPPAMWPQQPALPWQTFSGQPVQTAAIIPMVSPQAALLPATMQMVPAQPFAPYHMAPSGRRRHRRRKNKKEPKEKEEEEPEEEEPKKKEEQEKVVEPEPAPPATTPEPVHVAQPLRAAPPAAPKPEIEWEFVRVPKAKAGASKLAAANNLPTVV